MTRRLVVCLDGTWNSSFSEHMRKDSHGEHQVLKPTNTLKTCRAVKPFAADDVAQICYYDIGVGALAEYAGTANKLLYHFDRILGGAWAAGFEGNVEDALHFLAINFEPLDEVFVFGFSRGAAEARAVTEFLDWNGGLPPKDDAYFLPLLFRAYVDGKGKTLRDDAIANINDDLKRHKHPLLDAGKFRKVGVKYLGVWETVLAIGSRLRATGATTAVDGRGFFTGKTPAKCVTRARQALGVDEHRWDFRPEVWQGCLAEQKMEQRWFVGVHSNIGGGYGRDGLANIALQWMLLGAKDEGLDLNDDFLKHFEPHPDGSLYNSSTVGYRILDRLRQRDGHRPIPDDAELDKSIFERMALPPDKFDKADSHAIVELYRPRNVIEFLARKAEPEMQAYLARIEAPPLPADVRNTIAKQRKNQRLPPAAEAAPA